VRAIALLPILILAGCASSQRMSIDDLNYYQIDCNKREEQQVFLRSQLSSPNDRLSSVFNTSSVLGQINTRLDGTYSQHEAIQRREYDAIARVKLMDLNTQCGYSNPGVCDLANPRSAACRSVR
jgi:hypothetical protein